MNIPPKIKKKIELPYDAAIPLLDILKERKSVCQRDSYISVFTIALATGAKKWKQPRSPQSMNRKTKCDAHKW